MFARLIVLLILISASLCSTSSQTEFHDVELGPMYPTQEMLSKKYGYEIVSKEEPATTGPPTETDMITTGLARAIISSLDTAFLIYIYFTFSAICKFFDGHYHAFIFTFAGFSIFETVFALLEMIIVPCTELKVMASVFLGLLLAALKLITLVHMTYSNFLDFHELCFNENANTVDTEPIRFLIWTSILHTAVSIPVLFFNRHRSDYERID